MRYQRGFTLLEVMVALALMAAIALALTLLVSQTLDARRQLIDNRIHSPERLVDFLTRVDQQLSQITPRYAHERGQRLNTQALHLQNSNKELYWVAAGQWSLPMGDYYSRLRVWRLVWDPEGQSLILASAGLLDAAEAQEWIEVDRLNDVSEVSWSFWRQNKWQTSIRSGLPRGVRLTLTWQGQSWYRTILLPDAVSLEQAKPSTPDFAEPASQGAHNAQ